jgi:hypothetical protein
MNGEQHYDGGNTDYARAEVNSCKTTLVSEKNPFEVTGGEIVIRGHLKKVWLDLEDTKLLDDEDFLTPNSLTMEGFKRGKHR